jgi:hypothetical protein
MSAVVVVELVVPAKIAKNLVSSCVDNFVRVSDRKLIWAVCVGTVILSGPGAIPVKFQIYKWVCVVVFCCGGSCIQEKLGVLPILCEHVQCEELSSLFLAGWKPGAVKAERFYANAVACLVVRRATEMAWLWGRARPDG